MRTWAMQIVGLLNILVAIFVLSVEFVVLWLGWGRWPTKVTPTPMDWVIFALLLAISIYLVVRPALYGISLIKKDESAILPCALLFGAQTLIFLLCMYILIHARSMREIATGLWAFAILPIQSAVVFGYSSIGLIVMITLLILARRAAKKSAWKNAPTIDSTIASE